MIYLQLVCFARIILRREELSVKEGIHPEYKQTTITCACGNVIATGSTKENIQVEICSACHPFFTGKQKLVDTGGRVQQTFQQNNKNEVIYFTKKLKFLVN